MIPVHDRDADRTASGDRLRDGTDPTKLSTWQTTTVSVTVEDGGPMRRGARLHEIHRAPFGREIASVVEVADYEPGRLLDLRMIDGPLPSVMSGGIPRSSLCSQNCCRRSPHQ